MSGVSRVRAAASAGGEGRPSPRREHRAPCRPSGGLSEPRPEGRGQNPLTGTLAVALQLHLNKPPASGDSQSSKEPEPLNQ